MSEDQAPEYGNEDDLRHLKPMIDIFCAESFVDGKMDLLRNLALCGFATSDMAAMMIENEADRAAFVNNAIELALKSYNMSAEGAPLAETVILPDVDLSEFVSGYNNALINMADYARENALSLEVVIKLLAVYAGRMANAARAYSNPEYWIGVYIMGIRDFERLFPESQN